MTVDRIAAAAEVIATTRLSAGRLDVLAEAVRPRDELEGYRVQAAVHRLLAAEASIGDRIGYKIGCTTQVMQDYLGIASPCSGGVFAGGVHASGANLRHGDYRNLGMECEIAVRLGADLPANAAPFSRKTVAAAVAAYIPAVEIVDDRYRDWRQAGTPTLIADDFFSAGCVLGGSVPRTSVADAAELIGRTVINGVEAGRGQGSDVLGHPLNALSWLANSLASRGGSLKAGEIVLLGSLVETRWLAAGDRVRIEISGLGAVDLSVE
jgi:2-keto-4-pentenoate hydratase